MMCYQQMSDLCTYFTYLYPSCCVGIPWVNGSWGREGSRRVALDVFPVVLFCKQSSTEHQSSTENKNRHSSASFQHWENRPGPRTLGLQSCRKSEKQCLLTGSSIVPLMHHRCWGLGLSGKHNARFYMFRWGGGVRCCLVSPPSLHLDGNSKRKPYFHSVCRLPYLPAPRSCRG